MKPEEFVAALQEGVVDRAARSVIGSLRSPPGRQPWPNDVRRSEWFNSLDPGDQDMVGEVVRSATFSAAFAFCCWLDGVQVFDEAHGSLVLTYFAPTGAQVLLNDPSGPELHAELRGDGPPP